MNIIFDMDGTLVDSAKITIPAFKMICPKYNLDVPSDECIISAIGYANPIFYYKIFPLENRAELYEFGQEIEKIEKEITDEIDIELLYDGIEELLLELNKKGIKMYIASTGDDEHVNTCLNKAGIISLFEEIHCGKPDKEMMVADIIKRDLSAVWVMVGDKRKDSKAAKYNDIFAVGAGYGYCVKEDYGEFDAIIHNPIDLLDLLHSIE